MTHPKFSYRIGISGSYGGINLGDEGILNSIICELRKSIRVEITVFSKNPEYTLKHSDVQHAIPVRTITRSESRQIIKELDLFILGGGGILFDGEVEHYLREVIIAHEENIPVAVYAISAGPLKKFNSQKLIREHLNNCDLITVRDREGYKLLEDIGLQKEIKLVADPALLLIPMTPNVPTVSMNNPQEILKGEGIQVEGNHRLVAFSIREPGPAAPHIQLDHYIQLLADAADYIVDRLKAEIVFIPMERKNMDLQLSHAVISKMQTTGKATVLRKNYTPQELLNLFSQFELAVGMRLHFLIFAALQELPFVPLPYASKVTGFIQDLSLEIPKLDKIGAGRLIAYIDEAWDFRENIRQKIKAHIPILKNRARETNKMIVELLHSKRKR